MSDRASATSRAALASVSVALLLMALKAHAAWATGSVAMLGSLADSGLDLIASLVMLFAVRVAATPADQEHRFGHGKAEALAALFQTALIAVSALAIGARAFSRLGSATPPEAPEQGIIVSVVAIAVTMMLVAYQRRVITRTNSLAISADQVHYMSALLLNLAVIAALVGDAMLGLRGLDPVLGVCIALWLVWQAWRTATRAIDQLMDHEWPEEKRQRFLAAATAHPALRGVHDLRTRSSGSRDFVQFHIWVDPMMTVAAAHHVIEQVQGHLETEFPGVEILIHTDPEGHPGPEGMAA